jgi:D-glycero-alpha-D-manno-heptose 1-phosphate guanylyltransferase
MLVLAGGFGTRLQPVLPATPKAMAPIGGRPFLALQLENWISQGVRSFVFLMHHRSDQIISFLEMSRDGLLSGCELVYVVEPTAMDTGGAVAYALRELAFEGDFLVVNADTWLGSGIRDLIAMPAPAMAVIRLEDTQRYGEVKLDESRMVTSFCEKGSNGGPGWINAGLYRFNSILFSDWDGVRFSIEKKTLNCLASQGRLHAVALNTDFIDIGIPEDYSRFCRLVVERAASAN